MISLQNFNIGVYSHIYRQISFKLSNTTKFYIFISVWMTLPFIQGHSCIRNQKLGCMFSRKLKY